MTSRMLANAVRRSLEAMEVRGWSVEVSNEPCVEVSNEPKYVVRLDHPASHGLVLETGMTEYDAALDRATEWLARTDEIRIAGCAPPLTHPDLIGELRGLADMFSWESQEVSSLAAVLASHEIISADETDWLEQWIGRDAPGHRSSSR